MVSWLVQQTTAAKPVARRPTVTDDLLARQRALLSAGPSPSAAPTWLRTAAGTAAPPEEKPRSLWDQISHLVTGIPQGVAGLVAEAVESTVAVPRLGIDVLQGDLHRDERFSGLQSYLAHYAPAVNTIGTSFVHTGQRLTDPSEYLEAIKEGRIADVVVEDVGNLAIFGSAAGKVLGTAGRTIEAASLADARALAPRGLKAVGAQVMPAIEEAGPRIVNPAVAAAAPNFQKLLEFAPEQQRFLVKFKGRGLAGMAERAEMPALAQRLETVGGKVRTVAKLGERAGNVPAAPYVWAGKGIGRGLEAVGVPKLSTVASRIVERSAERGGILLPYSERGRAYAGIQADIDRAQTNAVAFAAEAARTAAEEGLTTAESSAVLFAVDQPGMLDALRQVDEDTARRLVNDIYKDVESAQRPTFEDIRMAWDYTDRSLPAERLRKMDLVRDRQTRIAVQRGEMLGIRPEHFDPELKPSFIRGLQYKIERRRESLLKRRGTEWAAQRRNDHLANAYDILADELPRLRDAADFAEGVRSREGQVAVEHAQAIRDLEAKAAEYEALSDGARSDQLRQVETELADATARVHELGARSEALGPRPARPTGLIDVLPEGTTRILTEEEKVIRRAGAFRAEANRRAGRVARIDKAISRADEKIANVHTELGRSFQTRLQQDVNLPMLNRWKNRIRRWGPTLGEKIGRGGGEQITGLLGDLARKHGVYDEVLARMGSTRPPVALVDEFGGVDYAGLSPTERGRVLVDVLEENGIALDEVEATRLRDSVAAGQLVEDVDTMLKGASEEGLALNAPLRVRELIESAEWHMPDELRVQLAKDFDDYARKRSRHLERTFDDYAEAIPARYRSVHQLARRQVRALLDEGERLNQKTAGSGDHLVRLAEETASTLAEYVEAGFDPQHLTGGREAPTGGMSTGRGGLSQRKQRASQLRRTGLRPVSIEAYARLEAAEAQTFINNRRNEYVIEVFGRRADDIPQVREAMQAWADSHYGEHIPAQDLIKAAREAGYSLPEGGRDAGGTTLFVENAIKKAMSDTKVDSTFFNALRKGNRMWKSWVLPISPKWLFGNMVGNVFMAGIHAGVGPVALARRMRHIKNMAGGWGELWERSGLREGAPRRLASHGLTQTEWQLIRDHMETAPRTRFGAKVRGGLGWSWKMNEFVDNFTRDAVYLEKLADGVPSETAIQTVLRSLGDFTRMSPIERRVIRELLPFYTWLRHSTGAMLRLPITSPTRAAFLLNLSQLYSEPDMSNELLDVLGAKFGLGGDTFFDTGSISPFPTELGPQTITGAISPFIKLPFAVGAGFNLGTLKTYRRPPQLAKAGAFGEEASPPITRFFSDPLGTLKEVGYITSRQAPAPIRSIYDLALGSEARYGTGYPVPDTTDPNRTVPRILLRGLNLPTLYTPPEQK